MGDVVALVEQVTANVDIEAAKKLADKVKSGSGFDLQDFLGQLQQMKQMGGGKGLGGMLGGGGMPPLPPGFGGPGGPKRPF